MTVRHDSKKPRMTIDPGGASVRRVPAAPIQALGVHIQLPVLGQELDLHARPRLAPGLAQKRLLQSGQSPLGCANQVLHRRLSAAHLLEYRLSDITSRGWSRTGPPRGPTSAEAQLSDEGRDHSIRLIGISLPPVRSTIRVTWPLASTSNVNSSSAIFEKKTVSLAANSSCLGSSSS